MLPAAAASTHDVTTAAICRPTNSITLNERPVVLYIAAISFGGQLGQTPILSRSAASLSLRSSRKALYNCTHPGYSVIVPPWYNDTACACLCYQCEHYHGYPPAYTCLPFRDNGTLALHSHLPRSFSSSQATFVFGSLRKVSSVISR